jgi:hypothetical protein
MRDVTIWISGGNKMDQKHLKHLSTAWVFALFASKEITEKPSLPMRFIAVVNEFDNQQIAI